MYEEQEMDYQSHPSRSSDTPPSSRRRTTSLRRGRNSITAQARGLNRSSNSTTSTPKPTRRDSHLSTQSSNIDLSPMAINEDNGNDHVSLPSAIPPPNPSHHSQSATRSRPFDCSSDDESNREPTNNNVTKSGKMKKADVLSYFTLQLDGRYECNTCHQVIFISRREELKKGVRFRQMVVAMRTKQKILSSCSTDSFFRG